MQTPLSESFDFGDFSQGFNSSAEGSKRSKNSKSEWKRSSGSSIFNERQSHLIFKLFKDEKACNLETVDKLCFTSLNFSRLWWGLLEYSLSETLTAVNYLKTRFTSLKNGRAKLSGTYDDV